MQNFGFDIFCVTVIYYYLVGCMTLNNKRAVLKSSLVLWEVFSKGCITFYISIIIVLEKKATDH